MSTASGFFDIPKEFRAFAEKGIEQSLQAYEGFCDVANETAERFEGSAKIVNNTVIEANQKAFVAADEGVKASFELASDLVRATSLQEVMMLQTKYMQSQMMRFGEVASAMGEIANKMTAEAAKSGKS
nr:phasin family protein [uncultured Cohaesibacter sp.]